MALPTSGPISINNINVELGKAGTTQSSLGQTDFRTLAGVAAGAISMSNFYGKANWRLRTGNLYDMTSDNAPSPFVATRTNNNIVTARGSSWQAFTNADADNFGCWVTNSGGYTQCNLAFNQSKQIRISKVTYAYNITGISTWGGGNFYIDIFNGSSWVQVFTQGFTTNGVRSGVLNVLALQPTMLATNIRARTVYGSGAESHNYYIRKLQVTEWYEKG